MQAGAEASGPARSKLKSSVKSSVKTLELITSNPFMTAREIAGHLGLTLRAVEKQLSSFKKAGRLRRIGPDKGGHWEVVGT